MRKDDDELKASSDYLVRSYLKIQQKKQPVMVVYGSNSSILESEAKDCHEFEARLNYLQVVGCQGYTVRFSENKQKKMIIQFFNQWCMDIVICIDYAWSQIYCLNISCCLDNIFEDFCIYVNDVCSLLLAYNFGFVTRATLSS